MIIDTNYKELCFKSSDLSFHSFWRSKYILTICLGIGEGVQVRRSTGESRDKQHCHSIDKVVNERTKLGAIVQSHQE